jgi:hypothetical protein
MIVAKVEDETGEIADNFRVLDQFDDGIIVEVETVSEMFEFIGENELGVREIEVKKVRPKNFVDN